MDSPAAGVTGVGGYAACRQTCLTTLFCCYCRWVVQRSQDQLLLVTASRCLVVLLHRCTRLSALLAVSWPTALEAEQMWIQHSIWKQLATFHADLVVVVWLNVLSLAARDWQKTYAWLVKAGRAALLCTYSEVNSLCSGYVLWEQRWHLWRVMDGHSHNLLKRIPVTGSPVLMTGIFHGQNWRRHHKSAAFLLSGSKL